MKLAVALVLTVAAFLSAAPSHAAPGVRAGLEVGAQVWGAPACGTPIVETASPWEYEARHGTGVFDVEPEAWADESRCAIVINPRARIRTAAKRCHVVVHEFGHLAGREHTERGVMAELDLVTEGRVRVGVKRRRWEWRASGAFARCYRMTARGTVIG